MTATCPKPATVTFNRDVYIPPVVLSRLPKGSVQLSWSYHALEEAARDDFDFAPDEQDMGQAEVVEVTTDSQLRPTKVVVRRTAKPSRDMVMVLSKPRFPGEAWKVVTAWANRRDDKHASLRRDRVAPPPVRV